jgi:hypothetical protein
VTQQKTANLAKKYDIRWYFAELYRHDVVPDPDGDRLERFLRLSRSDVESIVGLTRKHRAGQTWDGLYQLLERNGHEYVRDIGIPAATSWAIHLELLPRVPNPSEQT